MYRVFESSMWDFVDKKNSDRLMDEIENMTTIIMDLRPDRDSVDDLVDVIKGFYFDNKKRVNRFTLDLMRNFDSIFDGNRHPEEIIERIVLTYGFINRMFLMYPSEDEDVEIITRLAKDIMLPPKHISFLKPRLKIFLRKWNSIGKIF